ncbi:MAG TPA: methyltransferase [Polyangia bacterium]|nr:methyltransferase [Polyangia bacterium]
MAGGVDDDVTADTLLRGRVRLYQPARGARMSLDPVLLAGFLAPPYGRFLDIGCGAGPLAFLLLARDPAAAGVGVELQPRLAALAARGRDDNGWGTRLEIVEGDVRALGPRLGAGAFDLVATNPPYRTVASSPPSPNPERALAHNEIALRLVEWVAAAARAVRPGGRVAAILPAARGGELLEALAAQALAPARTRQVHPRAGEPASRVLVEARRGGGVSLMIEPPLVVHEASGGFTPEVRRMLGETA